MKKSKKEKEVVEKDILIDNFDDEKDELRELTELVGEGEYKVSVYRLSTDGTQWEKIGVYPLDQFNPDEIAKSYGGGKFKFRVLDGDGKFVRQMTVPYAIIKNDTKQDNRKDELLEFIKTELSSRDMLLSKILENLRPQQNQSSLSELITALSTLKSMEKSQFDFNNILSILKMGMNMTKELKENVMEEPIENKFINTLVEKLLPSLVGIISGGGSRLPQKAPLTPPHNKNENTTFSMQPNQLNYVSPFEKQFIENLKMFEKPLLANSTSTDNIPKVRDTILNMLSDDDILQLHKYLKEYSYHRVLNFIPNLNVARDWLKMLTDEIILSIDNMLKEEPDITEELSDTEELEKLENVAE